jgi:uncharacterized protein
MTATSTHPEDRFTLLDALRGFAIFGIFGVNMIAASLNWGDGSTIRYYDLGKADEIFELLINAFVEGKFYSIFSLLFGIGFGLQLARHTSKGFDGLPIFKRRLWSMLFIGFMHMMVLWVGDILFLYAWLGFILIVFRHKSDRYLLRASLICLAMPVILYPLRMINGYINLGTPFFGLLMGLGKVWGFNIEQMDPVKLFLAPGIIDYFKANVIGFFFRQADLFDQVRPFKVFSVFLLGFWVSRHRWYQTPQVFLDTFRRWVPIVLPASILINLAMAWIDWGEYYQGSWMGGLKTILYFLGVVPLSLCYVYLFTAAYTSGRYKILHAFTYVGRMALTNYLTHSILYVIFFRGTFLALGGKVGTLTCMVPVLLFFPLQIVFSKWWLQRYRFGPAEWLWRSMTYGKWQPMKRTGDEE